MTLQRVMAGFALALLTATGAHSAPLGFATDSGADLYTVDFGAGSATLIGNTGQFFEAIALAPTGTLYGTTNGGVLYSINTTTGAATFIGSTGLGNLEGLDFNGNTLLATDFNGTPSVYSLDLTTGAPTLVATANTATGSIRSMTVLNATTLLIRGDEGGDTLFSLDLTTGNVTTIGAQSDTIFGMDFLSDGNLYGLSDEGLMFSINPATAALTGIGDTGNQFWLSLTDAAAGGQSVPLPGTLVLIALASALAYWRRSV